MNQPFEPDVITYDERTSELDLRGLRRALGRKKRWIVWPTLLTIVGVGVYVTVTKPMYTAESQVLLENQENFLTRPQRADVGTDNTTAPDPESVASQVQLITSRDLAARVVEKMGLVGDPEFDPTAKGIGPISRALILVGLMRDPTRVPAEDRTIDTFEKRLSAYSPMKTRVVTVDFQAHDPQLAARIANEIVNAYLETQSDAKRQRAKEAAASLEDQISDLRLKVNAAADAVERYRTSSGLLAGSNNMTISGQQLADLNGELSKARTEQADAQAKAALIRDMISSGRLSDVADVANNDLVRRIAEQSVSAKAQLASESRTLLPGHPRIKELTAQIADLDQQLHDAAINTARSLENNARIAQARVANLQTAIDQQKSSVATANIDEVHLHELERNAQALRDQLDASMAKYQEAMARETSPATPADARIIARAVAPDQPSYPKKIPMLVFGGIAAFVLSSAAVIGGELLTGAGRPTPPNYPMQRPQQLGDLQDKRGKRGFRTMRDFGRSTSELRTEDESVLLRREPTILALRRNKGQATRVVATCAAASPLASADLLAFARSLARDHRPIVVDLDPKGRAVASFIAPDGMPQIGRGARGLTDLLSDMAAFAEVIHRDVGSRLHFIAFGSGAHFDPADLDLVLDAL
ncbi:MAG TPA: exopolysaccharide transport family protein, partial [Methylovirgula sp.]